MKNLKFKQKNLVQRVDDPNQRGSAIVIAVFVLVLVSVFVALALSRTAAEGAAMGNETAEGRTFYAAQGSLESMTRNFNKVFEIKLNPSDADFTPVRNGVVPSISGYTFNQEVLQTNANSEYKPIDEGAYAGLYALRDNWRLTTTATDASGVQVQLARNIINNRIPIFQFGIFYNDDMELHPGAKFDFGGRVHSNGSMFLMTSARIYFSSRVSAVGEIITDVNRNGKAWNDGWGENVFIKNGTGDVQLLHDKGSALASPANGTPLFRDSTKTNYNPDMPTVYTNSSWETNATAFGGNLLAHQKSLDLPLKIASSNSRRTLDYVELLKRGINEGDLYNSGGTPTAPVIEPVPAAQADSSVTTSERYFNKPGLRITLSDSKAKLPGCALGTGTAPANIRCGVRLDGASARPANDADAWGNANADGSRGYQPKAIAGYQATRVNGERLNPNPTANRQVWIKVELVSKNATTNNVVVVDVTEDILSLGVTEAAPDSFNLSGYGTGSTRNDNRSVIKLQRFAIPGVAIVAADDAYTTAVNSGGADYNIVAAQERIAATTTPVAIAGPWLAKDNSFIDNTVHYKVMPAAPLPGTDRNVVPFPIEMFDAREGIYNVDTGVFNAATFYNANVPWAGVMSMIDIDVANLKRFLDGNFNTSMPTDTKFYTGTTPNRTLANSDVPQNNGWVVYTSDRRGDYDFDGEYDMEDVFGGNDESKQTGEDVNKNGTLEFNYSTDSTKFEAARYAADGLFSITTSNTRSSYVVPGYAATVDHPFYRRGFRLINGERLPGIFDSADSSKTRGFTFASENGVYVYGNYNATKIRDTSTGSPTPFEDYLPQGKVFVNGVNMETADGQYHIPASIVGDAITILSNSKYFPNTKSAVYTDYNAGWNDAKSFRYAYAVGSRQATETFTRFAMIAGDPLSSLLVAGQANQGSGDARLSGGVHNFKRYLEKWGVRLNYCGSLINLYNSRNNNGTQKSGGVYDAPQRNWIFDSTFLDPQRLPPGTPYFQFVQTTGFQRTND